MSLPRRSLLSLASAAGYSWRIARRPVRFLPGLAGLGLISWGAAMVYLPAGLVVSGLSLLLLDTKIPDVPARQAGR